MFEKITEHTYVFPCSINDRPNCSLIVGDHLSVLFDPGASSRHVDLMKSALLTQRLPAPMLLIGSHAHWDHVYGAHAWDAPMITTRECNERLKLIQSWTWDDDALNKRVETGEEIAFCAEYIKLEYPLRDITVTTADIVFDNQLTLDLGGITCELIHCCCSPHSSDSLICLAKEERTLFISDAACKDLYGQPWVYDRKNFRRTMNDLPYDKSRVEAFLQLLDALEFTCCVDGHTKGVMSRGDLYRKLKEKGQ